MHSIAKIQSCILREAETWLACKLDLENHFIVYRITPNKYLTTHKNSLVNILYHTKIPQTGKKNYESDNNGGIAVADKHLRVLDMGSYFGWITFNAAKWQSIDWYINAINKWPTY